MDEFEVLAERAGVIYMGSPAQLAYQTREIIAEMGMDAQSLPITTPNSGVPAFMTTYVDPKLIDILVAPMRAAEIVGDEVKKGDWVTETAMFPVIESTGTTSSYDDYSTSGRAGANFDFPQRQSYHYQTMTEWGERELDRAAKGRIDYANRLNIASVLTLNKYQNKSYFYGVAGLQNYGLLNDPSLPASISPGAKAAGGYTWADATTAEILTDFRLLYEDLQGRAQGLVELDTPMVCAMSPLRQVYLTETSDFNVTVADRLKKMFPNLRLEVAPQYTTGSGEFIQLFVEELEGQRTVDVAFTEKLRSHPLIVAESSFRQKKSQGTWGAIIYRPFLVSSMLGI
jgi:hypothetical protein